MSVSQERLRQVQQWLIKAQHDLQAARALANQTSPLLDVAIYHCQQAAEKVIKGFLIFHDQRLEKTHNILVLVEQASKIVPEWSTKLDAAENLTQYAVLYRYPSSQIPETIEPTLEEFSQALQNAEAFYTSVKALLPIA